MERSLVRTFEAKAAIEGAGVHLHRGFGYHELPIFDPFLLFDDFSSSHAEDFLPGFPNHPHRGIETVTYLLEGEVQHKDSLGNSGTIRAGDIQWMTAGSGIIHEEMPQKAEGAIKGFQLWVNLPADQKMMRPRYRDIADDTVPVRESAGVRVKVIAGSYEGVPGPVADLMVRPTYLDVTLDVGASFTTKISPEHTAFIYVCEGAVTVGGVPVVSGHIGLLSTGDEVAIGAGPVGARFLFIAGAPLKEPIAWYGPIVMNTEAELRTALMEYQNGSFIKDSASGAP